MTPTELRLVVNGEQRALPPGATVCDVVAELRGSPDGLAVALNGDVVARSAWSATHPADGDRVEIITAAPGG